MHPYISYPHVIMHSYHVFTSCIRSIISYYAFLLCVQNISCISDKFCVHARIQWIHIMYSYPAFISGIYNITYGALFSCSAFMHTYMSCIYIVHSYHALDNYEQQGTRRFCSDPDRITPTEPNQTPSPRYGRSPVDASPPSTLSSLQPPEIMRRLSRVR